MRRTSILAFATIAGSLPVASSPAQSLGVRLVQSRSDYVLLGSPSGFAVDVITPSRGPLAVRLAYLDRRDEAERFDSTYEMGFRTIEVGPTLTFQIRDELDARAGIAVAWNDLDPGTASDQNVQPLLPDSPGAGWSASLAGRWRPFRAPMWGITLEARMENVRLGEACGTDIWTPFCDRSRFLSATLGIEFDLGARSIR